MLACWLLQADDAVVEIGWPEIGWQTLGLTAYLQGVLPLVWAAPWRRRLPACVQEQAKAGYESNALRNQRLVTELTDILHALAAAGIPAMPLKGSLLLEENAYGDPALRVLRDLDILIPPAQHDAAVGALLAIGYRVHNRTWRHIVLQPPAASGAIASWRLDHPDNPRLLDLHSHVREEFRGASYDLTPLLWQQAAPRPFLGSRAWVPTHAALLHHLTVHASVSLLERLLRLAHLADLLAVGRRSATEQLASALTPLTPDAARFVYPALALLAHYRPTNPLAPIAANLRGLVHPPLRAWLDASQLSNRTFGVEMTAAPGEMLGVWPRNERERLAAVRRTIFHSRAELAALYPRLSASPFHWLAHLRFWGRLLRSWSQRGWRRLQRREGAHGDC